MKPSKVSVWNMKAFDALGRIAYGVQRTILSWINRSKYTAYTAIVLLVTSAVFARRFGYLDIY